MAAPHDVALGLGLGHPDHVTAHRARFPHAAYCDPGQFRAAAIANYDIADSDGYEKDRGRPHAWRYRDYVIDSFNEDRPFDRFVMEQIAGDLLEDSQAVAGVSVQGLP